MKNQNLQEFKTACKSVLSKYGIHDLRTYGRELGLEKPAALKKNDLENEIVAVLCGELFPERNHRGKPPKNEFCNPRLIEEVQALKAKYLEVKEEEEAQDFQMPDFLDKHGNPLPTYQERMWEFVRNRKRRRSNLLMVADSRAESVDDDYSLDNPVYEGQFECLGEFFCALPLNGEIDDGGAVPVLENVIERYKLRTGDVITYHVKDWQGAEIVSQVLSINENADVQATRSRFDECEATYPQQVISLSNNQSSTALLKYLDFLLPVQAGQRSCILAKPKAGKTTAIFQIAQSLEKSRQVYPFVLLLDQPPESISQFRRTIAPEHIVCSSYEDDFEKQVFLAEFILRRAKRFAEGGKDVVLLVDSLNALGRAFNETDEALGGRTLSCGLEGKTLQYLKKYFGAARRLEEGGSLTIIGALSCETGNPVDDVIATELCALANHQLVLSDSLARSRIYPPIDVTASRITSSIFNELCEEELERYIKKRYVPEKGEEGLFALLQESEDKNSFKEKLLSIYKS